MKLKNLIILRHGEYEGRGFLTDEGRRSIDNLAQSIHGAGHINVESLAVLCSHELRAIKSAQAFIHALHLRGKVEDESYKEFYSSDSQCDVAAALRIIKEYSNRTETLVVFTHLEMVQGLPHAVGADVSSQGYHSIEYAQGFIIDCKAHTCEQV